MRFFNFYAYEFNWGTEVVSPRCGQRCPISHTFYDQLPGHHENRIHIEDPFLLDRNLSCVLHDDREMALHVALVQAAQEMHVGGLPMCLRGPLDCMPDQMPPDVQNQWLQHDLDMPLGTEAATQQLDLPRF